MSVLRCRGAATVREVLTLSDNSWRRFKSKSYEELGDWAFPWLVVFALLGLVVYCLVVGKPVYTAGPMLLLARLVGSRPRGGA